MSESAKHGISLLIAVVGWVALLAIVWHAFGQAHFFAFLSLATFYWITVFVTGRTNPFHIAMGADGRLSTSKFQFFVWTAVIVYVYVLLFGTLDWEHKQLLSSIPPNVLLVMGFSVTTAVAAKGITVSYLNSGQLVKPTTTQPGGDPSLNGLVTQDDSSTPDLTKVQMLIWTAIAAVTYLYRVHHILPLVVTCSPSPAATSDPLCKFPDIDQSLMVLMGISQGAYLGAKLVTAGAPQVTALSPSVGLPGLTVTLSGQSLGTSQNGSLILINGQNTALIAASWTDSTIQFAVPLKRPDGTSWNPGEQITVAVIINGQQTTSLMFAFVPKPTISTVSQQNPPRSSPMTIAGRNFGAKQPACKLLLNSADSSGLVSSWTDSQVLFSFSNALPGGAVWQAGQNVAIQLAISDDFKSDPYNVTTS